MAATELAISHARTAALAAVELKATSFTAIDVSERLIFSDVFLVISGSTERQVRALVDTVEDALLNAGEHRIRREGMEGEAHWVILDYGDLIIHVQQDEDRVFYNLERLWADCPVLDLGVELEEEVSTLERLMGEGSAVTFDSQGQGKLA